jgi:signal transduction histidine kinase
MTRPDDDWTDLTQAWTETPDPEPRLDAGFIRSLRRRDRLARLNFWQEMGGGVVVLGVMGWAAYRGIPLTALAAGLAFVLVALGLTLWSRRGHPGLLTETPQAVLRSAMGQARTGYRWALSGVAISVAAMIFLLVILRTLDPAQGPAGAIIAGMFGFLVICIGYYLRHARRCRRRMAAHRAALEALEMDAP